MRPRLRSDEHPPLARRYALRRLRTHLQREYHLRRAGRCTETWYGKSPAAVVTAEDCIFSCTQEIPQWAHDDCLPPAHPWKSDRQWPARPGTEQVEHNGIFGGYL